MANLFSDEPNLREQVRLSLNQKLAKQSLDAICAESERSQAGHKKKNKNSTQQTKTIIVRNGLKQVCSPNRMEELKLKLQIIIILKQVEAIQRHFLPYCPVVGEISGSMFLFPFVMEMVKHKSSYNWLYENIISQDPEAEFVMELRNLIWYDFRKTKEKGWAMLIPDEDDGLEPCWSPYFVKEALQHPD